MVLRPTRRKFGHLGDVPKPVSWLGMEKLNLTQQMQTFTNQTKCTQRTKARFSRLLRHTAWQRKGPILVSTLHEIVTYLLTYLDTYPLTYSPGPTQF